MAEYIRSFIPPYEGKGGWQNLPVRTSPVSAEALTKYDEAIKIIEDYLTDNKICTKASELENDINFLSSVDLSNKQDKLVAGNNIEIKGNIISAKNGDGPGSLDGMENVTIKNPQEGQFLAYNKERGQWENRTSSGSVGAAASVTFENANTSIESTNIQDAIVEVANMTNGNPDWSKVQEKPFSSISDTLISRDGVLSVNPQITSSLKYNNSKTHMNATNIQDAIDELFKLLSTNDLLNGVS